MAALTPLRGPTLSGRGECRLQHRQIKPGLGTNNIIVLMMTNMIKTDTLFEGSSNIVHNLTMHLFREDGFNLIGIVWNHRQEIEDVQPGMRHPAGSISLRHRNVGCQDDNDV